MDKDLQRLQEFEKLIQQESSQNDKRLSPRERLALLFDQGQYKEMFRFARTHEFSKSFQDGLVCGAGDIHGRPALAYASEFDCQGGSISQKIASQIQEIYRLARQSGIPIISLNESGGARLTDGIHMLEGGASILREAVYCSGVIPQISAILGHCIGIPALMSTLGDFTIMDEDSTLCISGARVNQTATGEIATQQDMGGPEVHSQHSGNVHFVEETEEQCLQRLRQLLGYLPANNAEMPPLSVCKDPEDRETPEILELIPKSVNAPFDISTLIDTVVDQDSFLEVQPEFAPNAVVGFGRFNGQPVGIIANQSLHLAGSLDCKGFRKMARFINFLAAFNFPLISFMDVPGALPTVSEHQEGILTHGSQFLQAIGHHKHLKISIIVRRCFGGTYGMALPKSSDGDIVFAYPNAMMGIMSDKAMTTILKERSNELSSQVDALHAQGGRLDDPFIAAAHGYVDDVINPAHTRYEIIRALQIFGKKRLLTIPPKWCTNLPL